MRQGIIFQTTAPKIDQLTLMANAKTYGEELFEEYLIAEGVRFKCELPISAVSQLFDFVIDHPIAVTVLIDVKGVNNSPVVRGYVQCGFPVLYGAMALID
jgi:hypothetical protein